MFANESHIVVCLVNGLVQYLKFAGGNFLIEKQFTDFEFAVVPSLGEFLIMAKNEKYIAFDFEGNKLVEVDAQSKITSLQIHPDGIILATGHENGKVIIWDIREGKQMKQVNAFDTKIRRIEFSYKGIHIMVVGESNTIKLWSLKSLEQDPKEFNLSLA